MVVLSRLLRQIRMPECEFKPSKYQGLGLNKLKEIKKQRLSPGLSHFYSEPLPLHQGHRQWLFDINGKRYLDMFGGICTVSVGHCHPKIVEAAHEQMKTLGHVSSVYFYDKVFEYAEKLTDKLPGDLKTVIFTNSGSEANDLAILLSRTFTKHFNIFSLKRSYHGLSCQTMGLTSAFPYKFPIPQPPGFYKTMNPDVFRGVFKGQNCRDSPVKVLNSSCNCTQDECLAGVNYANQLAEDLESEGFKNLAALFVESIQGVNGTVQFPKNYVKKAFDLVKLHGGLFVSDEVQTGFGRTGEHFWGFQMHDIQPDVVTMAKGIGNGFPLAAVVTNKKISESLLEATYFNTFGGNPVACAVGIAVLDVIQEENLQENCKTTGTYLLENLGKLKDEFPLIGDVRGKGLMIGIDFVEEPNSTAPMKPKNFMKIWDLCREKGVLIGRGGVFGNVMRLKPPMCITKQDADFTVEVLRNALKEANL